MQEQNSGMDVKTNLIINYLPQTLSDEDFYSLFSTIGSVYSARIIRDRSTGYSFGYGFVKYQNPQDAAAAIEQLNGFALMNKKIKVAYSLPSGQDNKNINVYIKNLPARTTNDSLREMFKDCGNIIECRAIPDKITGACQGIGFVLFSKKEEAEAAINKMNNQKLEGSAEPLIVKFAKTDQKRQPAYQANAYAGGNAFGANTGYGGNAGYGGNTGYGGNAGYGGNNGYGGNSYGNNYSGNGGYGGNAGYSWDPLLGGTGQVRGAAPGAGGPIRGMLGGRGRNVNRYSPMTGPRFGGGGGAFGGPTNQQPVPGGFIVFVYGIGPHTTEHMLWQLCSPYGDVKRVNVIKDHAKGQGKGYGFVTFPSIQEATYCVNSLNGTPFEGRALQVSLKS